MLRILQQFILTTLFAIFASQASAMFISPDPMDPTGPGVGTNRYAYSLNDPINRKDPSGYDSIWSNGGGTWSSSDGSTWDPETRTGSYDFGSDEYGYTNGLGISPAELPGYQSNSEIATLPSSGRSRVNTVSDRGISASYLYEPSSPFDSGFGSVQHSEAERIVQSYQPEAGVAGLIFDTSVFALGTGIAPAAGSVALYGSSAPRVFWSGTTAGRSVMNDAAAIAAQNGMKTLEMTRAGRALTVGTNVLGFNRTRSLWGAASAGFARSATNGSIAVQGTTVRTRSVWNTIERPILSQRGIGYTIQTIK